MTAPILMAALCSFWGCDKDEDHLSEAVLASANTLNFEAERAAEKIITTAKRGDLHSKRQVFSFITKETVAKKVIDELGPKYKDQNGGYCRIIRTGPRRGDAAEMAIIELV